MNASCKLSFFQLPPPSSRPPVTGYKISHNTTGSVVVNQTTDTNFVIENFEPGVYLFVVLATNILGDGVENRIVVTVTGYYNSIFTFIVYIQAEMKSFISASFQVEMKPFRKFFLLVQTT